ncbi:class II aldolase/adducin family protein, partial [Candidatus Bipolaricaulota bacterium]|nr:class II aldolase/adducin family protein [Candidatus Bipolaricaulota bacterium]
GTGGNISYSPPEDDYALITPSGVPYREIKPADIAKVDFDGNKLGREGPEPSSEAPMHTSILKSKSRVNTVIHTHSPFASTVATLGKSIPPIYYLIADIGDKVPLANYATYGTKEIAESALEVLENRNGVLLEKHGALAVGENLEDAYYYAGLIEELAKIYYRVLSTGIEPDPIPESELETLEKKFKNYGQ